MKNSASAVASIILLSAFCFAQDSLPAGDQDSGQSVAAAAKASRDLVQKDQQKHADIRRLLELTGAATLAQSMDGLEKNIRALIADSLPAGEYREQLVDLFFEKFHAKRDMNQLLDLVVPIYDKYYSDEEIKALIQFYETPVAKKMVAVLPKVLEESQAAGSKWGQELGRQCMMEVLAEHPELQKALEQAKNNPPAK
jgi:uncharacterized protein